MDSINGPWTIRSDFYSNSFFGENGGSRRQDRLVLNSRPGLI